MSGISKQFLKISKEESPFVKGTEIPGILKLQKEFSGMYLLHASFKAIRDYTVQFGTTIDIDKDRKGIATKYTITFNHLGAFKFHIHKLSNIEKDKIVKQYFKKMSNNGVAEVSVTDNKVATIEYKCSTSTLKLKLSYTVKNNYGTICSF